MRFEDRVTIVTGAVRDWAGYWRTVSPRGAAVVVADVAEERAGAVVDEISDAGANPWQRQRT